MTTNGKAGAVMSEGKAAQSVAAGIARRAGQVVFFLVLNAVLLFGAAGRLDWIWAWVFIGLCCAILAVNAVLFARTNPEMVAERSRITETTTWDKWIGGLWGLLVYLVVPLVAGLDVRFGWTQGFGPAWNVAGCIVFVASMALATWSMLENAWFSTAVRIQDDRAHAVCRSGPYAVVRHPGYVGFVLQSLATPILLGSAWALLPGLLAVAFMVARTALEDRMLQAQLPGYREFAAEVRYRLVPGLW